MTIYGRSEELVSRCVECDLAEPESLASLGGSAPGLVDGFLSYLGDHTDTGPLEDGLYRFKCITDHNLLIEWETGEQTLEILSNIIAVYAKKYDLLNTPGWKLSKRHSMDNNKWKEATDLELEQIKEYQVFKDFWKDKGCL